eukprot:ANDGO_06082.mRNA.1 hypothetical protein
MAAHGCKCPERLAASAFHDRNALFVTITLDLSRIVASPRASMQVTVDVLDMLSRTHDDNTVRLFSVDDACLEMGISFDDPCRLRTVIVCYHAPLHLFFLSHVSSSSKDLYVTMHDGGQQSADVQQEEKRIWLGRKRHVNCPSMLGSFSVQQSVEIAGDCTLWQRMRTRTARSTEASAIENDVRVMEITFSRNPRERTLLAIPGSSKEEEEEEEAAAAAASNSAWSLVLSITEFNDDCRSREELPAGSSSDTVHRGRRGRKISNDGAENDAQVSSHSVRHSHEMSVSPDSAVVLGRQHFNALSLAKTFPLWSAAANRLSRFQLLRPKGGPAMAQRPVELCDIRGHLLFWWQVSDESEVCNGRSSFLYVHNLASKSPTVFFFDVAHYLMFAKHMSLGNDPDRSMSWNDVTYQIEISDPRRDGLQTGTCCSRDNLVFEFVVIPPRGSDGGLGSRSAPVIMGFHMDRKDRPSDGPAFPADLQCIRKTIARNRGRMTVAPNAVFLDSSLFSCCCSPVFASGYHCSAACDNPSFRDQWLDFSILVKAQRAKSKQRKS